MQYDVEVGDDGGHGYDVARFPDPLAFGSASKSGLGNLARL